jgi:Sulfotransferase domain
VISTRSKTGTTWVQMICGLLILQKPQLDEPIGWYSPWLDRLTHSKEEIFARLEAQQHRRFMKTHTLDGVPIDPRATYIVAGRHPLDSAVSLYYQGQNINRERQRQLSEEVTGQRMPARPDKPRKPVRQWLLDWIGNDGSPQQEMDSIRGNCGGRLSGPAQSCTSALSSSHRIRAPRPSRPLAAWCSRPQLTASDETSGDARPADCGPVVPEASANDVIKRTGDQDPNW